MPGNKSTNNSSHPTNGDREHNDRLILLCGLFAIFCGALYFVASYFNIRPRQMAELFLYFLALGAAGYSCFWYLKNRKKRIDNAPIRPPMVISHRRDQSEVSEARQHGAIVMGHRRNGNVQEWSDL